jgi:DNA-binding NarL/FixJ family response regulator
VLGCDVDKVRVLVVADDSLVRAELAALLSAKPEWEVDWLVLRCQVTSSHLILWSKH